MTPNKFPDAEPSITLDFMKSKKLDPRITFTRQSDASPPVPSPGTGMHNGEVYLYPGNVPRLTDQGLLIEESRTNYNYPSNDLLDTRYTISSGYTNNSNQTAPDGSNDAVYFAETVGQNSLGVNPTPPTGNWTTSATGSVYVKLIGSRQYFAIREVQATNDFVRATFDLANESYKFLEGDVATRTSYGAGIQNVGNGWYRCWLTVTYPSATDVGMYFNPSDTDTGGGSTSSGFGGPVNTALANSGMVLWGYQIEEGTFPTSYIPTSGAEETRAADLCTINQAELDQFYSPSSSRSFVAQHTTFATTFRRSVYGMKDAGDNVSGDRLTYNTSTLSAGYRPPQKASTGTKPVDYSFAGQSIKSASSTDNTNVFGFYSVPGMTVVEGNLANTNSNPSVALNLGRNYEDDQFLCGYISRIDYYPTQLSDDALQVLTTQ